MEGWAAFGSGTREVVFAGGHHFHKRHPDRIAAVLEEVLSVGVICPSSPPAVAANEGHPARRAT
jgi:hypothetical protein